MSNNDKSTDEAIQEFLARGGVIQKIEPNVSGRVEGVSYSAWGRPKKPVAAPVAEVVEEVEEIEEDVELDIEDEIIVIDVDEVDDE